MKLRELLTARDVTTGRPWKRLLELALPMLIGNVAQALYNTVDTVVVGKYVGDNALSAVGAAGPLVVFLFVFFIGIATGAGILVSQRFGAKDREGLSLVIGNCISITFIVSIITTAFGLFITLAPVFGGRDLLQVMNTPEGEIYTWSKQYLTVIFSGVTAMIFYNILAGCMRALGDSVSALVFLLIACGINIGLDIYFVARLGLGVFGVALATVISQAISAVACAVKLFNMHEYFTVTRKELKLKKEIVSKLMTLGIPSGIGQGVFSLSNMFVQSLTNSMGAMVMACSVVIMRIDSFAIMPYMSLGNSMTTFVGQNYGAERKDRIEQGTKQGILISFITSVTLTSLLLVFGHHLAGWFTATEALKDLAVDNLKILAVGYIVLGVNQTLLGFLRGIGSTTATMVISIVTQVAVRVPLAYYFAKLTATDAFPKGQARALYMSMVCGWVLGCIMAFIFYFTKKKKL